jgi:CHAT domain-containing protein/uncharacterized protein HemY
MKSVIALLGAFALLCCMLPCQSSAQSREEGLALWSDGWKLEKSALSKKEIEQALKKYEEALAIFEKVKYDAGIWGVETNLGKVNVMLGRYPKGVEHYQKAIDVGRRTGSVEAEAHGLSGLGGAYFELGSYDKAAQAYNKALDVYKKLGDVKWEGLTLNHVGEVFRQWGKYSEALEYYQKALDALRRSQSPEGEADALHNMGEIHRLRGQYSRALEYYRTALKTYSEAGERRHEGIVLADIGEAHTNWGQYTKGLEYLKQSLNLTSELGLLKEEARALLKIGSVYQTKGNYDDALNSYEKCLEIYKKLGLPLNAPQKLIGDLYLDKGEVDKAAEFVNVADHPASLGRLNYALGKFPAAKQEYEKLLASAEENQDATDLFTAYVGLGKAYEALEDYEKARDFYSKGMKITEDIRSTLLPSERWSFLEVRINGFDRSEPAKGMTRVNMKLNKPGQSITSSEATRARAFSDHLSERLGKGPSGAPQEVLEQEEALVTRIAALKKSRNSAAKNENPERYENLTKDISNAEQDLEAFVAMLWAKFPAYASVKHPRPVSLKESALKPEEAVVIFDVSDEGVGVKLINGKEIVQTFYSKWPLSELESSVKTFRRSFEKVDLAGFDVRLAELLYRRLLASVLSQLPPKTAVTIIPDGVLAVLPFEALVMESKASPQEAAGKIDLRGLKFVGDVYPISYYQSITALTLARTLRQKSTAQASNKVLVVADPVFKEDDSRLQNLKRDQLRESIRDLPEQLMSMKAETGVVFERLPRTSDLADSLKELYAANAETYTGLEARKDSLLEKPLDQYNSIVFATHGYFGNDIPKVQEPVLVMSLLGLPDISHGFLKMSEVMQLKLNAEMVALTACQTGLGPIQSGEGVMGMGRAFQFAGARSVLMSLWSVDEKASVDLVRAFFRHMKEGKSKLEALSLARASVREQGYLHPFYWSSFILVGETD